MSSFKFLAQTALRDSRKNRGKLFLFMSSIILGIAALVAINSFNYNLMDDVDAQAATLLGADLEVESRKPLTPLQQSAFDSLPGDASSELELLSMAYLPSVEESQFIRIKAIDGGFPYYGKLKTEPVAAADTYKTTKSALVEDGMMLQYELNIGDSIRIGQTKFEITGRLLSAFGSAGVASAFAPIVYISQDWIPETDLVKPGSLVEYKYYKKLSTDLDIDQWRRDKRRLFRNEGMRLETVESNKEDINEAFSGLNYFLNLVALVSLLLGCIGVASSVFIYVKNKIPSIAVFRCLGMKGSQAFMVYFLQIFVLGVIGVLIGAILGSAIQLLIPMVLSDFLPFEVSTKLSWPAILEGISVGALITILFALLPLIAIRKVSPLRTLRSSVSEATERDPLRWLIYFGIFASIFTFLWRLTGEWKTGIIFSVGLLIAFLILFLVSKLIIWGVKNYFPKGWNFVFRQGLSNLFRPNNQTQTLLVSIGLGTAVLTTLFIIQGLLLNNVAGMDAGNQPNMILWGIENEQADEIAELTRSYDLPIIQQVPIVTMKLAEWKGKTKAEWQADTTARMSNWAMNRELRVSYRDTLTENEKLLEGEWIGKHDPSSDSIFISLDKRYSENLELELGDEIVFNVQGTLMKTYLKSLRQIEFDNLSTRFFILFPTGVLEDAPQFQVMVSKSPDTKVTANYRRQVNKTYPNISVIDLGMILSALNEILNKVSYIIKFMAAFSILTGLIVLLSSLLLSKFQRIRESVLLRTLGASRNQILKINATEYTLIGVLSAATGIIISLIASYLIAKYELELEFDLQWWPIIIVFLLVVLLTVGIGLLNSRDIVSKSPLEVLRKEVG